MCSLNRGQKGHAALFGHQNPNGGLESNHAIHQEHLDRQVRVVKPTFSDAAAVGGGFSSEC
jgi:hypothetical protein